MLLGGRSGLTGVARGARGWFQLLSIAVAIVPPAQWWPRDMTGAEAGGGEFHPLFPSLPQLVPQAQLRSQLHREASRQDTG